MKITIMTDKLCKLPRYALDRAYSFILSGSGYSTEIGEKRVRLVIDKINYLTAYQNYNEFNEKKNCKRYVIDLRPIEFVYYMRANPKFTPTLILENENFQPYYVGKITCASLTKNKKLAMIIDSNGFELESTFKDFMPTGELKMIRMQIDSIGAAVGSTSSSTGGSSQFQKLLP